MKAAETNLKEKATMKRISKETKTFKVFNALQSGDKLTQSEATKRFGVKNLSAEASRIRANGYAVYANSRKAGNGVTVTEYELGRPSREIVALGYAAKARGLTVESLKG
jgi:cobalamin biosynthesis protein CbiG